MYQIKNNQPWQMQFFNWYKLFLNKTKTINAAGECFLIMFDKPLQKQMWRNVERRFERLLTLAYAADAQRTSRTRDETVSNNC